MRTLAHLTLAFSIFVFGCGSSATLDTPTDGVLDDDTPQSKPDDVPRGEATDSPPPIVAPAPGEPLPDPIVEQPSGAEEKRILAIVAPKQLADLHRLVGRYARGEAPIYEGTFGARDNRGSIGAMNVDTVMDSGPVDAALAWEEELNAGGAVAAGWALTIRGVTHGIRITQSPSAPGITTFSHVAEKSGSFGVVGTCNDCFPILNAGATTLATTKSVATGRWGTGSLLEVTAAGSLTRVPLARVTFERIAAVVDYPYVMKEFKVVGGEMVRTIEGRLAEPTPVPQGQAWYSCEHATSYKLDWFVDRAKLVRHGLRNMSIPTTETCCYDGPPGGCRLPTCF